MSCSTSRDQLFAESRLHIEDFAFDESVAKVFPDMIQRSVPAYATIISMIGVIAGRYACADSRCYDLGCSLGAATLSMRHNIRRSGVEIIAVDNAYPMVRRCKAALETDRSDVPVSVICADIGDVKIERASIVVLNFTLQFIDPSKRLDILSRIYQGLLPGGVLVLSEKVAFEGSWQNDVFTLLHHDFKRANGYSDLEISQKRAALEKVLMPESIAQHKENLSDAGFAQCDAWFQCFNFASMLAIK